MEDEEIDSTHTYNALFKNFQLLFHAKNSLLSLLKEKKVFRTLFGNYFF